MTGARVAVIGVASSAGTHHAGQDQAPAALRAGGFVAGAQRRDPTAGLLYLDGDADLATPETTGSGVLDAMGIAHLLGLADTELARLGDGPPMLTDDRLAL